MITIGLTGGIGCGKSMVAEVFNYFGIPIYNSDDNARRLMTESTILVQEISQAFGSNSYINGELNKAHIRNEIFSDNKKRETINSIVHPMVGKDFLEWTTKQQSQIVLFESALLFQSQNKTLMDYIFAVSAPQDVQIKRIIKRDGIDKLTALQRIHSQYNQLDVEVQSDEIILNDGMNLIIPQVINLLKKYING